MSSPGLNAPNMNTSMDGLRQPKRKRTQGFVSEPTNFSVSGVACVPFSRKSMYLKSRGGADRAPLGGF